MSGIYGWISSETRKYCNPEVGNGYNDHYSDHGSHRDVIGIMFAFNSETGKASLSFYKNS